MANQREEAAKTNPATPAKPADAKAQVSPSWGRTFRETVESIVIAFVLAFLFRTFEAEAFVIPTGSMAPTLQGRHKDVQCTQCGYWYRAGVRSDSGGDDHHLGETVCPMCGFRLNLDPQDRAHQTFNGDRILVSKFAYDFNTPKRWDVVVFKYPEDAKTNYIKRLIGLPGETIKIQNGDIFVSTDGGRTFEIARKETPHKLLAMLQDVYDNDHVVDDMLKNGWPARWQNVAPGQHVWQPEDGTRAFSIDGQGTGIQWLRYQHLVPNGGHGWRKLGEMGTPRPELITDFYAYNLDDAENWVGDLSVEFEVEVRSSQGDLVLELVEGGQPFRAQINLATGKAHLLVPGLDDYRPSITTPIRGPGTYRLRFANIDDQLLFWVDDELIEFDSRTTYEPLKNHQPFMELTAGHPSDLSPVGIGSSNADVRVSHLNIKRDVYYTNPRYMNPQDRESQEVPVATASNPLDLLDSDKDELDRFFMLGDNSPASKDSRLWEKVNWVERRLLIGKAIYVYWPHSWPAKHTIPLRIRGTRFDFPFWPNWERMGLVR